MQLGTAHRMRSTRGEAAQTRRNDGLHVRNQISSTRHCLRSRRRGVSEGLQLVRATVEEELQPPSTVRGLTMPQLDSTHDPALRSWVPSANGHLDFPIQNLPFC